ncbi:hypothetical protein CPB84DRAFT_1793197 [Gymnopilus junonius]|uniref:Uncharacterized protein n=1 Tax=Gymnopilus junonius TaxID=109634 RepID=A0A9P5NB71_GYMJU|nr:hypothetical protein CPB84DRAFT_1793197 [Gymnopilus junonius]
MTRVRQNYGGLILGLMTCECITSSLALRFIRFIDLVMASRSRYLGTSVVVGRACAVPNLCRLLPLLYYNL